MPGVNACWGTLASAPAGHNTFQPNPQAFYMQKKKKQKMKANGAEKLKGRGGRRR